MENLFCHIFQQVQKQDKRCNDDRAPVSRSISMWQMWRPAVVCCWQGTVRKLTGHIACVSVCTHPPVHTRLSVYSAWFSVDSQLCDSAKQKNEIQTDTQVPGAFPSSECVVIICSIQRLNQGWLPPGRSLQLNRLYWRNGARARTLPAQSSCLCSVYQWVTGFVYMWFQ